MKIESYKVRGETKYRFRVYVCTDPITKKEVKIQRSGFESKKEAQLACAELLAHYDPARTKRLTYQQLYEVWLDTYRLSVKDSTLRKTEQMFRDHILPFFGSYLIEDIRPLDCQRFANEQARISARADGRFVYMAKVLDFAVKNDLLAKNPAAGVTKPRRRKSPDSHSREVNFYTKEQLKEFLRLAKERLSPMWFAFFRLLAYTGMRRGEALALQWSDLEGNIIHVRRTIARNDEGAYLSNTPKTDKSNRNILIDDETLRILNSLERTSPFIFPNEKGSFSPESQPVRQLHKAVDGTALPYISPHGLRHTHCSLLFSAGASIPEVQDRLGHSDVKTTIDIYNHVYPQDKEKALSSFLAFMGEQQ